MSGKSREGEAVGSREGSRHPRSSKRAAETEAEAGGEAEAEAGGEPGAQKRARLARSGEDDSPLRGGGGQGRGSGVIEEGTIQWFYRPKVDLEAANSLSDIQRFFILLRPSKPGTKCRLCIVGKKRLPSARMHERFFGFVKAASDDAEELLQTLGPQSYETKTRGTRHLAAARALGQGTYVITEHKDHTALVYKLEVPSTPGQAQLEFVIGELGSFVITMKNPANKTPADPGLAEKAELPHEKQAEFGQLAWIPVHDTQLLDFPRAEFLLIGTKEDVPPELGNAEEVGAEGSSGRARNPEPDEERLIAAMREEMQADELGINMAPIQNTHKLA